MATAIRSVMGVGARRLLLSSSKLKSFDMKFIFKGDAYRLAFNPMRPFPPVKTPYMIHALRRELVFEKIMAEYEKCADIIGLDLDARMKMDDFEVLKDLLKEIRKFNRENSRNSTSISNVNLKMEVEKAFLRRRFKKAGYRSDDQLYGDPDHPNVCQAACKFIHNYNTKQNLNLDFRRVIKDFEVCGPRRHMVVQVSDPASSGATITLNAAYFRPNSLLDQIQPAKPVSFMDVLNKDESRKTKMSFAECQTLLFANIHNCPTMDSRLGLKGRSGLHPQDFRGYVLRVSLDEDDGALLSLAKFALTQQNKKQKTCLGFERMLASWLELLSDYKLMYHITMEASETGVTRAFYTAVTTDSENGNEKLIDWVAVDAPRATIKLPC